MLLAYAFYYSCLFVKADLGKFVFGNLETLARVLVDDLLLLSQEFNYRRLFLFA